MQNCSPFLCFLLRSFPFLLALLLISKASRDTGDSVLASRDTGDSVSNRQGSTRATRPEQQEAPPSSVTYPSPKTFPERLMLVLESLVCPDTIWWEHDGTTVALHVGNLKNGEVLTTHFQGIRYKFFIRYMTRCKFSSSSRSFERLKLMYCRLNG
jgi:hypothetical protein